MKDPILLAGVVAAFGCLFAKRTPVSLVERGCLYARAAWLLAAMMAEAAWDPGCGGRNVANGLGGSGREARANRRAALAQMGERA